MKTRKSIEERGGIVVKSLEDIAHECFANEAGAILDCILVAILIQRTHLAIVQQDRYPMLARRWFGMQFLKCLHLWYVVNQKEIANFTPIARKLPPI